MRCHECEADVAVQPRYCTCCGRPLESVAPLTAEPSPLTAPAQDAVVEEEPAALPFGDPAPFDPIALVEAGFAEALHDLPMEQVDEPATFAPIAPVDVITPLKAGSAECLDDGPPFEPIALIAAHTVPASVDSAVTQDADASPDESFARLDAGPAPAGMIDACPIDTAPQFRLAEPDAAPRFEPVALVEAAGDDVLRTEDHAAGAVHDVAEAGVPAPEDAVVAFDEPLVAPAPWWQSPRLADRGNLDTAPSHRDPVTESPQPEGFDPRPSPPEAVSPGGTVVEESRFPRAASEPEPRQSEATPPELHESSDEPPRIPAPGRRPRRQPASNSRFSRHTGLALVAAAVLIVAVVVGAPSIVFWPPYVPPDPAIAPPVSEAELAAAVAALQSQPLTDSASSTVSTVGAKPPASSTAAASTAVTQAPPSKRPDRNATAKRRTAAKPASRPEPPRVQNEPAAVSPVPLATSSINVPAQTVHAPAAAQTALRVPSGPAYEATQVDTRPQVESQVAARVPDHLRDRRFEEALVVRVLVSSVGRASDVRVLRGSRIDASLDAAALTAVKQWRFSPARRRGQAVDCWFSVGVPFRSEGGGTDR